MMQQRLERLTEIWMKGVEYAQARWRWLGRILVGLAWLYILALVVASWPQLRQISWRMFAWPVVAGLGLYLLSLILQFLIWAQLLSQHRQIDWYDVMVYARSILLRRLPGGVWHWVGRTAMYLETANISAKTVMLANFLEWLLFVAFAGAIVLSQWGALPWLLRSGLALVILSGLGWLLYTWQPASYHPLRRLLATVWILALTGASWAVGGLLLWGFVVALGGSTFGGWDALWVWAFSGGSSMLIVFIPAGLGVREVTLTFLLQPFVPLPAALMTAVLIRIVFLAADVLWGGLGWLASSWLHQRQAL